MSIFLHHKNGSAKIFELRKQGKLSSIDILDFWDAVDTWKDLEVKDNVLLKYVFCFVKFDPNTCTADLKELENVYGKVDTKRIPESIPDFKKFLKKVYDGLVKLCKSGDGDKSIELEYETKVSILVKCIETRRSKDSQGKHRSSYP